MTPGDWGRVSEILSAEILRGKSTFDRVCPTYEKWDSDHLKVCRFVYELDGNVAGWIALSPTSPKEVRSGVVEVSVYIDEAYWGRGIGTALLQKVIEQSPSCGIWSLYSAIFPFNAASIAIHKKCGFREIGYRERIAKDRFGIWQDTVLFELRLETDN